MDPRFRGDDAVLSRESFFSGAKVQSKGKKKSDIRLLAQTPAGIPLVFLSI